MPPSQILAGLRVLIGAGAWATPTLASKVFGLDPEANPQASYFGRLFGIRDVILGLGTLATPAGSTRRLWWKLGIATDAMDVAAAVLGGRDGSLPRSTTIMAGGTALAAVGLGVAALQAESDA